MLRRILGLLGWLGVALVFAAVAIRFLKPEWQQWYSGLAMAGLVCTLLYMLSQWREIARSFSGREAKFGTVAVVILCWSDRPSVPVMAVAGLLIGYATVVRSVGQPLLAVVLVGMLVRRVGWRRLVTLLIAGIVPIAPDKIKSVTSYHAYFLDG